jgi:hypothetical protein
MSAQPEPRTVRWLSLCCSRFLLNGGRHNDSSCWQPRASLWDGSLCRSTWCHRFTYWTSKDWTSNDRTSNDLTSKDSTFNDWTSNRTQCRIGTQQWMTERRLGHNVERLNIEFERRKISFLRTKISLLNFWSWVILSWVVRSWVVPSWVVRLNFEQPYYDWTSRKWPQHRIRLLTLNLNFEL